MSVLNLTQEDLEKVADIYDVIRVLYKDKDPSLDKLLSDDLENHLRNSMTDLTNQLSVDAPDELLEINVLQAKFSLFEFCIDKIASYMNFSKPASGKILKQAVEELKCLFETIAQKLSKTMNEKLKLELSLKTQAKEIEDVLVAAEALENAVKTLTFERDELKIEVDRARNENQETIAQLETENKKFLEKIIKLSKQSAESSIQISNIAKKEAARELKPFSPLKPFAKVLMTSQIRDLTLKQTKDLIEELYDNKLKYDLKCIENRQPRETLEQFMHSYLYKKYGLKSITTEMESAMNKAIIKYNNDTEVSLFGKILKNEIDEEFQIVLKQVKDKALDILKQHLKAKFPYMQEKAVKELVIEKSNGELEEDEWATIVSGLYSRSDAEYLQDLLSQNSPVVSSPTNKQKKPKVSFIKLMQVVQEFQIAGYESYLKPIVGYFNEFDEDHNGILNISQFQGLLSRLNIEENIEKYNSIVDPFRAGVVTFTDFVTLLNTEQAEKNGETLSLLQKVYTDIKDKSP
ncbi:unnamed protein product [Blepharisma stoltei]|uniref:EF-hand domain-containing protein n=1 Tax=Blepharisma stoltei TaxID=1481888 RepID=A0AAU9J3Y1_9CILI|nr:unnamed protein product [Blepharisma stoltei]